MDVHPAMQRLKLILESKTHEAFAGVDKAVT